MHILVLTKRQYMSRDLLDDRYGRFWQLPLALARLGHSVSGFCLSYRQRDEGQWLGGCDDLSVSWHALNLWRLLPIGADSYWAQVATLARSSPPDLVLACSDAMHVLLGAKVARQIGAPLVVDLYDNFESFGATRWFGITGAYRRAVIRADGVVCISRPLAGLVQGGYGYRGPLAVIENAVPGDLFRPRDRAACRRELGLPAEGLFIGTAGALSHTRGIAVLFDAFARVRGVRADVQLVLAGPRERGLALPGGESVHYLGHLPPDRVPLVVSALDVSVICNRPTDFGRFCFPQKFYESVACEVPVISAATGSLRELLADFPAYLYVPDDAVSLAQRIVDQLDHPRPLPMRAPDWTELGSRLSAFMQDRVVRGAAQYSTRSRTNRS